MTVSVASPPTNGNGQHKPGETLAGLLPHHLAELRASGLSDDTIRGAGIRSENNHRALAGILNRKTYSRKQGAAIVYPFKDEAGAIVFQRVKPDTAPKNGNGKASKYLAPTGSAVRVYFPPGVREAIDSAPGCEIVITEGEKKTLAAAQAGLQCIGLVGVDCWHRKKSSALLPDLDRIDWNGCRVYLAFDSDAATNENVRTNECLLADTLKKRGAQVWVVRFPPALDGAKVGLDDFLVAHDLAAFRKLLDEAQEPEPPEADETKIQASDLDPYTEAVAFLERAKRDGVQRFHFWRDSFFWWRHGRHVELDDAEARAEVVRFLNPHTIRLSRSVVSNVLQQLMAQAMLPSRTEPPAWLCKDAPWPTDEVVASRNKLIHLPSFVAGRECMLPATPDYFRLAALDYSFDPGAARPHAWLDFLNSLWPDDSESIDTLQMWFGYLLVSDTRQQKILLLVGPKRSGKGTIARLARAVVGKENVAGPTLSSFSTNFGLWPLLGKTLAIVSDARLSGRTDTAIVIERLLSISGEDCLTIDRKHKSPLTCKLGCRLMLLTNELPKLSDASGALISRMLLLRTTKSFYGAEDHTLTDRLLDELPGILLWSIEGWRRLHETGRFKQPQSSQELLGELHDLSSPISAFIREHCDIGPGHTAPIPDLFARWEEWCKDKGRKPGHAGTFGRDLLAAVPHLKRTQPRSDDGERYRAYEGIGLRKEL